MTITCSVNPNTLPSHLPMKITISSTIAITCFFFMTACSQEDLSDTGKPKTQNLAKTPKKIETNSATNTLDGNVDRDNQTMLGRLDRQQQRLDKRREKILNRTPSDQAEHIEKMAKLRASYKQALVDINSEESSLRESAIPYLNTDNKNQLNTVKNLLLDDPSPSVRTAAIYALSFGDEPTAIPSLIEALSDSDSEVVIAAIDALTWYETNDEIINSLQLLQQETNDSDIQNELKDALDDLTGWD